MWEDGVVKVIVPLGSPLEGRSLILYPDSGATTYTEGRIKFVSAESLQAAQLVRELHQALGRIQR